MQLRERLDGVVRASVGSGRVEVGDSKARVRPARKLHHGKPVRERRSPPRLQGLMANRSEENFVQIEYIRRRRSDRDMAVMWWVETAAEEGYAHRHSLADCD